MTKFRAVSNLLRAFQCELRGGAAGEVLGIRKGEREKSGRSHCPFLLEKTMNTNTGSWLSRNRWILMVIGVPVIAGTWWAFRPEKLFINQKVNEAAPATLSSEPDALYTGKLEGQVHQTSGRATIYKTRRRKRVLAAFGFHDLEWARRACAAAAAGGQGA